jgi:hypothetical protein
LHLLHLLGLELLSLHLCVHLTLLLRLFKIEIESRLRWRRLEGSEIIDRSRRSGRGREVQKVSHKWRRLGLRGWSHRLFYLLYRLLRNLLWWCVFVTFCSRHSLFEEPLEL